MFIIRGNTIRPAFIGYIKNNKVRRLLCCMLFPFTLIVAIVFNLIGAVIRFVFLIIIAFYVPLTSIRFIKNDPIWYESRHDKE